MTRLYLYEEDEANLDMKNFDKDNFFTELNEELKNLGNYLQIRFTGEEEFSEFYIFARDEENNRAGIVRVNV